MSTFTIVMIVILVILIGVLVGLYIFGKKAEKKQAEQQEQMAAAAQVVSMLIKEPVDPLHRRQEQCQHGQCPGGDKAKPDL